MGLAELSGQHTFSHTVDREVSKHAIMCGLDTYTHTHIHIAGQSNDKHNEPQFAHTV